MKFADKLAKAVGFEFTDMEEFKRQLKERDIKGLFDARLEHDLLILLCEYVMQDEGDDSVTKKIDKMAVYNPLDTDFITAYDVEGNGEPQTFVVPAHEIAYFNTLVGNYVKKHLTDEVLNTRGVATNVDDARLEVMKEISAEV